MPFKTVLVALAALNTVNAFSGSHPVQLKTVDAHTARAMMAAKGHAVTTDAALFDEQGFWFGHFSVGGSADLSILIDTGSSDAIINPGVYKPSKQAADTHQTFRIAYATTNPDGTGELSARGEIYTDTIGQVGTNLTVPKQYLGSITSPKSPPTFPHDGLIGFAHTTQDSVGHPSFFANLCNQGALAACRFGLALKTDKTGTFHYGTVATSEFSGSLVTVPIQDQWTISGDITVNGQVQQSGVSIATDSGTTVIFGPTSQVRSIFDAAGIQYTTDSNGITGYYACDKPPQIGISFSDSNFNIASEALAFKKNGNNCTASIHGTNNFGDTWLVGQAFFQGKYIDHDYDGGAMGFAYLN